MNFFLTLIHGNRVLIVEWVFTPAQKKRMLLSAETLLGIRVTGKLHHFAKKFSSSFHFSEVIH